MRTIPCDVLVDALGPGIDFPYTIEPGETVVVEVADCFGGFPGKREQWSAPRPNPVTGPLAIAGAKPGQTVAVDIHAVEPVGDGFIGTKDLTWMRIDTAAGVIHHPAGFRLPLRPCIGTIGVCPADARLKTVYAGDHGGNMDANIVGAGTTVCFRVQLPGGGLGMGDVHATMGDGELSGQGLECAARITVTARLVPGLPVPRPHGLRDQWLFVVGWGLTIGDALAMAQEDMKQIVMHLCGVDDETAFRLQGLAVNMRAGWATGPRPTVWLELDIDILPPQARNCLAEALGVESVH